MLALLIKFQLKPTSPLLNNTMCKIDQFEYSAGLKVFKLHT